jgi:glucose-6-phosphate 1-dehydrogenase
MTDSHSDVLVFFGATGDLAYKKIFPTLQAMVKRGHLNIPVIGVARSGWNLEQLRTRAHESLVQHGGVDPEAFGRLSDLPRLCGRRLHRPQHVSGAQPDAQWRAAAGVLPGNPAASIREGRCLRCFRG